MKTFLTLLTAFTVSLFAPPVSGLELSALNGTNGFRLDGMSALDFFVSEAGDVNGDGFEDVLVGVRPDTTNTAGRACLIFGKAAAFPATFDLNTLDGTNGFIFNGLVAGDAAGASVSTAGDVNGDGYDDILIGASSADPGGVADSGQSYLVFGGPTNLAALDVAGGAAADGTIALSALNGVTGFLFNGATNGDQSGFAVSGAGDVNGDGYDDLLIGAPSSDVGGANSGATYLIFGGVSNLSSLTNGAPGTIKLGMLSGAGAVRIGGAAAGDAFGVAVRAAGDVNGDGYKDFIIGAPDANAPTNNEGRAYVIFGRVTWPSNPSITNLLTAGSGTAFAGGAVNQNAGSSVSGAGDFNGDGFDDVIIGAPGLPDPGRVFVLFGRANGLLPTNTVSLNGTNGFTLTNEATNENTGISVSGAGDVNGDGLDDLLVGAPAADPHGTNSGQTYVIYGRTNVFGTKLNLSVELTAADGFPINGVTTNDFSGNTVRTAGDVNGDGFGDVIIESYRKSTSLPWAYVVFGSNFTASVTHAGDTNANTLTGTAGANVIVAGQNADTLLGLGGADVLYGAQGDDILAITDTAFQRIAGGRGFDTLRLDGAGLALNLTNIPNNRITGIEQIDIGGTGSNTLTLSPLEVLNLSGHANTLIVRGDTNDSVLLGSGWSPAAAENIGGEAFRVFTQGAAVLKILCAVAPLIPSVELSALLTGNGTKGVTLFGADEQDQAGASVRNAGDVNNDGYADVIIGAPYADGSTNDVGRAYVVFGRPLWLGTPTLDLATLGGTNGFTLLGTNYEGHCGYSVSGAGDVNGDGFDDVIVGAPDVSYSGSGARGGVVYVVFGKADWMTTPTLNLGALDGTNGFLAFGTEENTATGTGRAVRGAGDVNGDGLADIVIGQRHRDITIIGSVTNAGHVGFDFVVFGRSNGFPAALDLETLDGTIGFTLYGVNQEDSDNAVGHEVSGAGDVNGDGFDDLLIGRHTGEPGPHGDPNTDKSGEGYVVFGKPTWSPYFPLASLNGTNGFTFYGTDPNDRATISLGAAGDVNGDGFDDIIVGADGADGLSNLRTNAGESYIVFGKSNWTGTATFFLSTLNGNTGFRLIGVEMDDGGGLSVNGAGDVNGDGFADLIVGAQLAAASAGESYVVYGHTGAFSAALDLGTLNGANGFTLFGVEAGDNSGFSVSRAGDVNGDGYGDLIIGAPGAAGAGNAVAGAGECYLIFGGPPSCAALADTDGDGIPDWWEMGYTNNLTTLTANGDADGDGRRDADEYVADTNPLDPTDVFRIIAAVLSPDGLTTTLTWTSKPTRRYRVEQTTDLALPFATALDNIVPDAGTTTTRAITHSSVTARFFRVAVFLPPIP